MDIDRGLDEIGTLPKKITDITANISKGAASVVKMTDDMETAINKVNPKNPAARAVIEGLKNATGALNSGAQHAENVAKSIENKGKIIADKISPVSEAAKKISQSADYLKECQDVLKSSSILVDAIIDTTSGHFHPRKNEQIFTSFSQQWDQWAKNTDKIFHALSPDQQVNVLEALAKQNFGNEIFYLGSAIKNNSAGIFGGIADFEDSIHQFRGSYRNPIEAAQKIEAGVKGIIRATERVANSLNNMIKVYQKGVNGIEKGNPILSYIGSIHDNPAILALNRTLTIGVTATSLVADVSAMKYALESKNPLAIYATGKNTVDYIKTVSDRLKDGANAVQNTPLSKNCLNSLEAKQQSSGTKNGSQPQDDQKKSTKSDSYVCSSAKMRCSYGDKISTLTVFPDRTIWITGQPQANISDHLSMQNIAPFGKCHTRAYPATGSATSAAHGRLTPMPCVPNTPFPWMDGKNDVLLQGQPALLKSSKCKCIWGGTITIIDDGQK